MTLLKIRAAHRAIAASALLAVCMSAGIGELRAQDNKLIRVSANRSASAVSLWGFDPFGKKYGLRVEVNAATTNADMQRAVQSGGGETANGSHPSPAGLAEQKVSNVKPIAGGSLGGP